MDIQANYVAISCVSVGIGSDGSTSMLARVALLDFYGAILLDTFVTPTASITDLRTASTGFYNQAQLHSGTSVPFKLVQERVASLIKGKILLGHALWLSLSVLGLTHPTRDTRDVALYYPFLEALKHQSQNDNVPRLQMLMWKCMQRRCCEGPENPVENCRAILDLWRSSRQSWESAVLAMHWPCVLPPSKYGRNYT